MAERQITARQRHILTVIVESYIAVGEPVSSGAIARLLVGEGAGVSSATVRNEMAELAEAGLLEQPHTSAGRVPSAQGFQLYVQQLPMLAAPGSGLERSGLRSEVQSAI